MTSLDMLFVYYNRDHINSFSTKIKSINKCIIKLIDKLLVQHHCSQRLKFENYILCANLRDTLNLSG